ncbi:hypothetical protein RND71_037242 [Anisodus tanguticus]|uniref:Uncharacterized protein n=1 Tax=Anisodus tanguticus TaxID=243964 RepID=A0AAE1R3D1_9SOLA|nr:hypothetical protein RND71_037242 [Anisodus tanguticus]
MEFRLCIIFFFSLAMIIDPSSSSLYNNFKTQYKNFDQLSIMHGDNRAIASSTRKCNGLVGNCIDQEEEMMMESDISRRVLQGQSSYISYSVMSRNNIPCNVRGASYYNCHAHQQVNPYRRGCTKITRCARTNS